MVQLKANVYLERTLIFRFHDCDWFTILLTFQICNSYLPGNLCVIESGYRLRCCEESRIYPFPYEFRTCWQHGAFQREETDWSGWDSIIRMSTRSIKFRYDVVDQANVNITAPKDLHLLQTKPRSDWRLIRVYGLISHSQTQWKIEMK